MSHKFLSFDICCSRLIYRVLCTRTVPKLSKQLFPKLLGVHLQDIPRGTFLLFIMKRRKIFNNRNKYSRISGEYGMIYEEAERERERKSILLEMEHR